ncbi:MAG: hydrogenase-4 component E [Alphaproteobacteria bacterium]
MHGLAFDVAHMLAGAMLVASFALLFQRRMSGVIDTYAVHSLILTVAAAWQAYIQDGHHLFVTAAVALVFKTLIIPIALRRIVRRLEIHRSVETVIGVGPTMLLGVGLVALSILLIFPVTETADALAREDLALALSVILLGLLMMITRRNAITQVIGFLSLENGLILAAVGVRGMPLVVEISVAFSVLAAFVVFGVFFFRIRERFDTLDVQALGEFRGERR